MRYLIMKWNGKVWIADGKPLRTRIFAAHYASAIEYGAGIPTKVVECFA